MQIPISQNLPLRFWRNTIRNIFAPESRIEIFQPFNRKKRESEDLEKVIQEKQKRHENHKRDLQLQQSVKCFLNIIPRSDAAERIKQGNIKDQREHPNFGRNVKLSTPESRVNKNNGNSRQPFGKINIEISFHWCD